MPSEGSRGEFDKYAVPASLQVLKSVGNNDRNASVISAFHSTRRDRPKASFSRSGQKNSFYNFGMPTGGELEQFKRDSILAGSLKARSNIVIPNANKKKGLELALPFRNFADNVLVDLAVFLLGVNSELEDLHLRLCVENDEYFSLFEDEAQDPSAANTDGKKKKEGGRISQKVSRRTTVTQKGNSNSSRASYDRRESAQDGLPPIDSTDGGGGTEAEGPDIEALMRRTQFPYRDANQGFLYPSEMWFAPWGESVFAHNRDSISGGGGPTPLVSVAVTEEPPLLVAGMLVDPVTDRFLFQGAAFREEARVLAASVPRDTFETDLDKLNPQKRAVLRGLASRNRVMKLLVREYISLSEIHVNNLGGRFMVQTISLLSPQADAEADRKTLLSPQKVRELLPFVQSGCVSRVFSVPASGMTGGKREEEALDGGEAAEVPEEETAALPPFVGHRESTVYRDPMEEELALRQSNPRLLDNLLRRDPSNFVESGDKIRAACIFYSRNVLLKRAFRQLIEAATRIQEFLRACIAKKRRACERMLRAWRLLELESKFKLMHYKPPPSSVERIDMIANNVLQQHMTTTKEDKMRIIEDLWEERRKQYRAHMHKKRYNEWVGRKVNFSDPSLAVKDIIDRAQSLGGVDERELYDSGPTSRFRGNEGTFDEWNKRRSTAAPAKLTSTKATEKREMDYIHTHFGWYIPPELLLYESHRRLLKALKNSVLTTEHVQYEVERNRLKDPAAEINNASTSLPPVDQKAPPGKFSLAFLKHTDL